MSVKQRIGNALAAHGFGQVVTLATQLLLTPLYFRFWGAQMFGEWLLLFSIPAFFAVADLGLGSAAANDMSQRVAAGDQQGAQRTFWGAMRVMWAAAALTLTVGGAAATVAGVWGWPHTPSIGMQQAAVVLLGLALWVALGFVGGLLSAGFRCCSRNATGVALANAARLLEGLAIGLALWLQQAPWMVCVLLVAVRLLMLLLQYLWLLRVCAWLFAPGATADQDVFRRLIRPSLGFLAFPLGGAIALQLPVMIVGSSLGGAAVAGFVALRTLARLPAQLTNMINSSIWPEMSRAHGQQNGALLRRLHRLSFGSTAVAALGLGSLLFAFSGQLMSLWLGPHAIYSSTVALGLVALTVVSAIWNSSAVVLVAINAHLRLGVWFVVCNVVSMLAAMILAPWAGWAGLLWPMLMAELVMMVWVLRQTLHITQDRPADFLTAAFAELRSIRGRRDR